MDAIVPCEMSYCRCLSPAGVGAGISLRVVVTNLATTLPYTWSYDNPILTLVNPSRVSCNGGDVITVYGANFGPSPTSRWVYCWTLHFVWTLMCIVVCLFTPLTFYFFSLLCFSFHVFKFELFIFMFVQVWVIYLHVCSSFELFFFMFIQVSISNLDMSGFWPDC